MHLSSFLNRKIIFPWRRTTCSNAKAGAILNNPEEVLLSYMHEPSTYLREPSTNWRFTVRFYHRVLIINRGSMFASQWREFSPPLQAPPTDSSSATIDKSEIGDASIPPSETLGSLANQRAVSSDLTLWVAHSGRENLHQFLPIPLWRHALSISIMTLWVLLRQWLTREAGWRYYIMSTVPFEQQKIIQANNIIAQEAGLTPREPSILLMFMMSMLYDKNEPRMTTIICKAHI